MKRPGIPPAGLFHLIGLALITPGLAVMEPTTVKPGDVSEAGIEDSAPQETSLVSASVTPNTGIPDVAGNKLGNLPTPSQVADDASLVESNVIGHRLSRVPGDSPFLFLFVTLGAAVVRKTRFPAPLRWRK